MPPSHTRPPRSTADHRDAASSAIFARIHAAGNNFFGPNGLGRRLVLERTTSGGVSINETNLHYAQDGIPFGGIGPSGMGAYHGHEGFKTLSHAKGVFEQAKFNLTDAIRPPFGRLFERVVRFLTR